VPDNRKGEYVLAVLASQIGEGVLARDLANRRKLYVHDEMMKTFGPPLIAVGEATNIEPRP
jgi:hypothetical protein